MIDVGNGPKDNLFKLERLQGSFDVVLLGNDGSTKSINLKRSYHGLLVPANQWRRLENFSTNSVSLHLSSGAYDEHDYIREISEL